MDLLFFDCSSLIKLPNISKWNISKVSKLEFLFGKCLSLKFLPDISSWDTSNILSIKGLFYKCSSLIELPDISKWKIDKIYCSQSLFYECSSLKSLPDISQWNINSVIFMDYIFYNCSSLISLPDISKWKILKNIDFYLDNYKDKFDQDFDVYSTFFSFVNEKKDNDLYLGNLSIKLSKPKSNQNYIEYIKENIGINGLFTGCSTLEYYLIFLNGISQI